jgi:23S rRNA pseudouridine1911/1915/1917 synthase
MPRTLLDALITRFPLAKRTTLRSMLADGRVWVDGRRARSLKQPVDDGAKVEVRDGSRSRKDEADVPTPGPLTVVYEDTDLLVVDKPPGLLTSTGPREKRPTALKFVREYMAHDRDARVGLIHRLDRDASGLLVFSKSHVAYESLKTQFFRHTVTRAYAAVVSPAPKERAGTIDKPLEERADGTVYACRGSRGQRAVTHYEVMSVTGDRALLRVKLETGRKHQIRVHLSTRGWPIVGDTVYRGAESDAGLMLRAIELAIDHPKTGQRMTWTADVPKRWGF